MKKARFLLVATAFLSVIGLSSPTQAQARSNAAWTQASKLTATDGASGDLFGQSIAISGDTVVVGAPMHKVGSNGSQGAAYVFVRPASGWSSATVPAATLVASDGQAGDQFGFAVAISGDTVVVGSHYAKVGSNTDQGAAYVFTRPGAGWSGNPTQNATLTASDGAALDTFGDAVAIDRDSIAVGADNAKVGSNAHQGAVYVYQKPGGGGWGGSLFQSAKLTASVGLADDFLGLPVSISGAVVAAGARFAKIGSNSNQGAAYIFVRPGSSWSGNRTEAARLTASDGANNDEFGSGIAINGSVVVAGAPGATVNHNASEGAGYVFVMPGGGWSGNRTEQAKLTATGAGPSYHVGVAATISGSKALLGSPLAIIGTNGNQGAAYAFAQPVAGWSGTLSEVGTLVASDGAAGDTFGNAVSIDGGNAAIAAYQANIGNNSQQGAAYSFIMATSSPGAYLPFITR